MTEYYIREVYEEVKLPAKKSGKCLCGKRLTRQTTLSQTINPYNKNADGEPKSRSEIMTELAAERDEWMKEPVRHVWHWSEVSDERKRQREAYARGEKVKVEMSCGEFDDIQRPTSMK